MNAVREIEAAIGALERLKAEVTPGEWFGRTNILGNIRIHADGLIAAEVYGGDGEYEAESNVALIVTLHRTVDAQLAVLEAAIFNIGADRLGYTHATVAAAIKLARSINGTST